MKQIVLKKLHKKILQVMQERGLSARDLAQKSKIPYTTLMSILHGISDTSVSNFSAICEGLGVTADTLLEGIIEVKSGAAKDKTGRSPKFLIVLISIVKVTYCMLYDIAADKAVNAVLDFPLRCGDEADFFIDNVVAAVEQLSKELNHPVAIKDVAVFASVQQFGRKPSREKIQNKGSKLFCRFYLESDAVTNHDAFFGSKNGICVTINTGDIITYSLDGGKTIHALQGYGFPISDSAGNYWIGCEAIKHVLNVLQGEEPSTLVSDRILAQYNNDINFLSRVANETPQEAYLKASSVVKEFFAHQDKARDIVKQSFELLYEEVRFIDKKTNTHLPIVITGELAYLYEGFFDKKRLVKMEGQQSAILLAHGLTKLKQLVSDNHQGEINEGRALPFA